MITRREWLIALGAGALAPMLSRAQPSSKKVYRIGYLAPRAGMDPREEALRQRLRELGYVEGRNLVIEWRFSKGKADLLSALAAELVRLGPDCIVVSGATATRAAKEATNAIPIVMANTDDDPVLLGFVASLARPGGNITGFTSANVELAGKRLELLKETVPNATRVAVLWDPNSLAGIAYVRAAMAAAPALGMQIQSLDVRNAGLLENALRSASKRRAEALLVSNGGWVQSDRALIADLAVKARLPVVYAGSQSVYAGGLMSYGSDANEQFRRAATYVDNILKGAKPADLPVEQPAKFELVINLKAAKQIGLSIPAHVLARADKVIE